jgi:hypothetical protein
MRRRQSVTSVGILAMTIAASLLASPLWAEEAAAPASAGDATELAKKTQNPVADLISVPFQNDLSFGLGPRDATQWVMNVQPVIPIKLTDDWNLITRTIIPIIYQGSPAPGIDHAGGIGDVNPSLFLSPAGSKTLIWGVGPTMTFPTASDKQLGAGKYSAGPAVVALTMQGPWVVGALANNQWSFAGWRDTKVNALLVQPFVNYNFGKGWYVVSAPIVTANWVASSGDKWTVPVGGGGGRLIRLKQLPGGDHLGKLGELPVNTQIQAFYNPTKPDLAGDWQLRLQVQFLFPK